MNNFFSGLLLLSTNILQGYGDSVSDSRNFTGTLNHDLTLSWTLTSRALSTKLSLLYIDSVDKNNVILSQCSTEITALGKAVFGERFIVEKLEEPTGVLNTTLKNVQFNDTGRIFIWRVLYVGLVDLRSTYIITKVEGGPVACDDPLQSNYTFDENQSPPISLTLCGVPKPTVEWKFNSKDINTAASVQQHSRLPYCYKYDVMLPYLTQNLSGKTLTYSASGYSGNNILQGSSKIFINSASVGKSESDDGGDNIGVIVGVVCGLLVLIIIIIIIMVYCKKKRSVAIPAESTKLGFIF